jgi:LAO/AO transport system kinase
MTLPNAPIDIITLAKELRVGHHSAPARVITLIESRCGDHQAAVRDLAPQLLPESGKAVRVGGRGATTRRNCAIYCIYAIIVHE